MYLFRWKLLSSTFTIHSRGGDSHIKRTKEPLRGAKILLCVCGLKCFSPPRGTAVPILKQHMNSFIGKLWISGVKETNSQIFPVFLAHRQKCDTKAPVMDLLILNTLFNLRVPKPLFKPLKGRKSTPFSRGEGYCVLCCTTRFQFSSLRMQPFKWKQLSSIHTLHYPLHSMFPIFKSADEDCYTFTWCCLLCWLF